MRGTIVIIVVLFGLLAAASTVAYLSWRQLADVEIGFHGFMALGLGVGLTILLGVGLMSLAYYSQRAGYDDEAGRD